MGIERRNECRAATKVAITLPRDEARLTLDRHGGSLSPNTFHTVAARILELIAADINPGTRTDTGREGLDYWHICVLAAVRLGCDLTYDQLQDLAENHRTLRASWFEAR